ncbi:Nucleosomal histone H3-Lys79 methylase [Saitozyma podzolica]|uniref:Histone-lysine N-methyltransferase, H3 lysine-79 specific n=1 Tax=Saitozyma podzolica TaxID=1890683 RepID=A0A427Y371_9TREE|nr:Nucleosomal histone H3-Lys79 methylase [Saitozyma podzolica]
MLGFFGDKPKKPGSGPIVSKVTVKRPVLPSPGSGSASGSGSGSGIARKPSGSGPSSKLSKLPSSTGSASGSGSSSTARPNGHGLKPKISSSNLSSSLKPSHSHSPSSAAASPRPKSGISRGNSALSSHSRGSTPVRKRRTPSPIRSESESESDGSDSGSSSDDALDALGAKSRKKRRRLAGTGTGSNTGTATPLGLGIEETVDREVWCLDKTDMRGEWGRGWAGFVGSEEVTRGVVTGWAGGNAEGKGLEKYQAYFPQPGFENAEPLPSVELLYPATGCREKYILLTPTSPREYSPISELRTALRTILDRAYKDDSLHPPSHAHIFGTLSSTDLDPLSAPVPSRSRLPTPAPTTALATPPPDASSPVPTLSESSHLIPGTPMSISNSVPPPQPSTSPAPPSTLAPAPTTTPVTGPGTGVGVGVPGETIADALRKALAPNRRDGPGFLRAMERFNEALAEIQKDGSMARYLRSRDGPRKDAWSGIVDFVHDQAYSRVVGPYSNELEHHPKHPDEVARAISAKEDAYGELRHNFMSKVIDQLKLGPESKFVDLGSGVGNCVLQVALQAGSHGFGIELLPVPAHCARLQLRETQRRWAMWGLKGNVDVEFAEGDFRTNADVPKRLREADVVLVNNEVFPPSLNADLTNMFLDLKEGATIVSLKPFVPEGFRMNESNRCGSGVERCRTWVWVGMCWLD